MPSLRHSQPTQLESPSTFHDSIRKPPTRTSTMHFKDFFLAVLLATSAAAHPAMEKREKGICSIHIEEQSMWEPNDENHKITVRAKDDMGGDMLIDSIGHLGKFPQLHVGKDTSHEWFNLVHMGKSKQGGFAKKMEMSSLTAEQVETDFTIKGWEFTYDGRKWRTNNKDGSAGPQCDSGQEHNVKGLVNNKGRTYDCKFNC